MFVARNAQLTFCRSLGIFDTTKPQPATLGKFPVCPYGVVSRGRSRRWHCHTQIATDSICRRARMESQRVGRGRRPRRPGLRAAEDVRPYRRHRGPLGQRHRVFHSKKLRCTFAQMLRCQRHLRECPKLKCKSRTSSPEQTFAFQSRQRFCRAARFSVSPEGMEMAISRRPCPFSCFLV